jgi:hypothetical protein
MLDLCPGQWHNLYFRPIILIPLASTHHRCTVCIPITVRQRRKRSEEVPLCNQRRNDGMNQKKMKVQELARSVLTYRLIILTICICAAFDTA